MEKSFKGTPGNWYIEIGKGNYPDWVAAEDGPNGNIVCEAPEEWEESMKFWDANKYLIAASKDLLEACIAMVAACNKYNIEHLVPEYEAMTTAISKALNTTSNE